MVITPTMWMDILIWIYMIGVSIGSIIFSWLLGADIFHAGVHMTNWTWDPGLQWRLDYFSMVDSISQWDPGSLVYFCTMAHTYPWDPGIWLYTLIASVKDNAFIRGMEC